MGEDQGLAPGEGAAAAPPGAPAVLPPGEPAKEAGGPRGGFSADARAKAAAAVRLKSDKTLITRLRKAGVPVPPELAARVAAGAKAKPQRVEAPLPKAGAGVAGEAGAPDGAPAEGVTPWQPDVLKPLFEQVVPALEKSDVAGLVKRAAAIDEAIAKEVARDAWWNPAAKAALIASGPACAAELLNEMGVGQDKAHWVAVLVAGGSIYAGRALLVSKLAELEGKLAKQKTVAMPAGAADKAAPAA